MEVVSAAYFVMLTLRELALEGFYQRKTLALDGLSREKCIKICYTYYA